MYSNTASGMRYLTLSPRFKLRLKTNVTQTFFKQHNKAIKSKLQPYLG